MSCDLQPNLLSAHRKFVRKLNVLEVGDELRGKGTTITLFIFTDSLEVGCPLCVHLNVILNCFCTSI